MISSSYIYLPLRHGYINDWFSLFFSRFDACLVERILRKISPLKPGVLALHPRVRKERRAISRNHNHLETVTLLYTQIKKKSKQHQPSLVLEESKLKTLCSSVTSVKSSGCHVRGSFLQDTRPWTPLSSPNRHRQCHKSFRPEPSTESPFLVA